MPKSKTQSEPSASIQYPAITTASGGSDWLNSEKLGIIADSVARLNSPIPDDLAAPQLLALIELVRRHRRERLIKFIGRAIGDDICRSFTYSEVQYHAQAQL